MASRTVTIRMNTRFDDAIARAADDAIAQAAEYLLGEANQHVPRASGDLEQSGDVIREGEMRYAVVYTTPYARRQHDDTSLRHPDPRNPQSDPKGRAKWLEDAAEANADDIEEHVRTAIARESAAQRGRIR